MAALLPAPATAHPNHDEKQESSSNDLVQYSQAFCESARGASERDNQTYWTRSKIYEPQAR